MITSEIRVQRSLSGDGRQLVFAASIKQPTRRLCSGAWHLLRSITSMYFAVFASIAGSADRIASTRPVMYATRACSGGSARATAHSTPSVIMILIPTGFPRARERARFALAEDRLPSIIADPGAACTGGGRSRRSSGGGRDTGTRTI